ncbi:MAG: hypothetical protein G3M78_11575 [Candidatus Nitrohelix vancouverensis]|uniref:Uncharacterized protein n=1 Tax=Candidatus Nitrohelix vancouverensis TaxID=2705534 RepID=A0A7T0C3T1_9BACT|nr:MAG: hypothetical protein G3M78_11575 [Candidatus Nitrohelix vancouverensis]
MRRLRNILSLMVCVATLSGCMGWIGPASIKSDRNSYNTSIQKSDNEQLLLNLVRLKYRDTPFFLEVSGIASQFTISADASLSATLQKGDYGIFGPKAGMLLKESPTVTYSPLQGEQFIQRFLSQIPIDHLYLLYKSGWSIERVMRIAIQQIGPLKNAPNASGPTPKKAPEFEAFVQVIRLIRHFQVEGLLSVSLSGEIDSRKLTFKIDPSAEQSEELKQLRAHLKLPEGALAFSLGHAANDPSFGEFTVETRSLLGIMYYLSHAVETPQADAELGNVTLTVKADGTPFDWKKMSGDLLNVRTQESSPDNPAVSVKYGDNWFYISQSDLDSKSTFSLLGQIFSLQAGNAKSGAPLLTLPVGN